MPSAVYWAAVSETIFVIAAAPVIPDVLLRRSAEIVPDDTDKPPPTITAPAVLAVADGRRAAGSVPDVNALASVVGAATLNVPSPAIVTFDPALTPPSTLAVATGSV